MASSNNMAGIFGTLITGAVAGLAATWVKDRVGDIIENRQSTTTILRERLARVEGKDPSHALANKIARKTGIDLHLGQPHPAGMGVHYGIGAAATTTYALLKRQVGFAGKTRGLLFGLSTFLLIDEALKPLLGVSRKPTAYPYQTHLRGLAGHLVFGLAADATIRAIDFGTNQFKESELREELPESLKEAKEGLAISTDRREEETPAHRG